MLFQEPKIELVSIDLSNSIITKSCQSEEAYQGGTYCNGNGNSTYDCDEDMPYLCDYPELGEGIYD